jgi:hypothetical protein
MSDKQRRRKVRQRKRNERQREYRKPGNHEATPSYGWTKDGIERCRTCRRPIVSRLGAGWRHARGGESEMQT